MGLKTSPNYCRYFLLFKLIAVYITFLFSLLKVINVLVAKFFGGRRSYNRAEDRGLDKANSLNKKRAST